MNSKISNDFINLKKMQDYRSSTKSSRYGYSCTNATLTPQSALPLSGEPRAGWTQSPPTAHSPSLPPGTEPRPRDATATSAEPSPPTCQEVAQTRRVERALSRLPRAIGAHRQRRGRLPPPCSPAHLPPLASLEPRRLSPRMPSCERAASPAEARARSEPPVPRLEDYTVLPRGGIDPAPPVPPTIRPSRAPQDSGHQQRLEEPATRTRGVRYSPSESR